MENSSSHKVENFEFENIYKKLQDKFSFVCSSLFMAVELWEKLPISLQNELNNTDAYPFGKSLDEVAYDVASWCHKMEEVIDDYRKGMFDPTMKVGDLKKLLANIDDDVQVVIGHQDWFNNITMYHYPDGENYVALTLELGDECNTRQF